MSYYIISDELYHHGILGQKWGIRRYQNPDGSLSAAGRERYGKEVSERFDSHMKTVKSGILAKQMANIAAADAKTDFNKKKSMRVKLKKK